MAVEAYVNGYRAFAFADFSGGLNLRDKSDAVGDREAIDLLNVTFADRGAIRQRDGYDDFTPADLTLRVDSLSPYYGADGTKQLVAGCGTRLEALNTDGGVIASHTGLSRGPYVFARFGDPTHEYLYAANGIDVLRRWNGAAWVSGAALATVDGVAGRALPRAGAIAVTAAVPGNTSATNASNRLIATAFGTTTNGGPNGTQSTPSRVFFSNPGQPELWETDGGGTPVRGRNYIDLTPGDGEAILAAVTWRELVFIFKETKFFVLWGEGTGADGTPTFQVREVVNSVGLASALAVAVGRDGVYFFNRRGVYRTSGGDPVLLSDVITPMWTQDPEVYFRSRPINLSRLHLVRMLWHMERLYLAFPSGDSTYNDRVLVYDTVHEWWTLYDWPAAALASFRSLDYTAVHFGYSGGAQRIGRSMIGRQVDRLDARMISRWRSGWSDYGSPHQRTFRETRVWGSGGVIVSFSTDFNEIADASRDALFLPFSDWPINDAGTWDEWIAANGGRWPGIGQPSDTLIRYATRGFVFSTQFANSARAKHWAVHRVARHLREAREPSMR